MNHTFYYRGFGNSENERFLDSARWILSFTKDDVEYHAMQDSINKLSTCCFNCRVLDLIWQLKSLELKNSIF